MKNKRAVKKIPRKATPPAGRNLRQKNIAVALMVLALVFLFFFITYTRLKTGANPLG